MLINIELLSSITNSISDGEIEFQVKELQYFIEELVDILKQGNGNSYLQIQNIVRTLNANSRGLENNLNTTSLKIKKHLRQLDLIDLPIYEANNINIPSTIDINDYGTYSQISMLITTVNESILQLNNFDIDSLISSNIGYLNEYRQDVANKIDDIRNYYNRDRYIDNSPLESLAVVSIKVGILIGTIYTLPADVGVATTVLISALITHTLEYTSSVFIDYKRGFQLNTAFSKNLGDFLISSMLSFTHKPYISKINTVFIMQSNEQLLAKSILPKVNLSKYKLSSIQRKQVLKTVINDFEVAVATNLHQQIKSSELRSKCNNDTS